MLHRWLRPECQVHVVGIGMLSQGRDCVTGAACH
jgi:hypothetical protein